MFFFFIITFFQALLASSYVPFYSGILPARFRGRVCLFHCLNLEIYLLKYVTLIKMYVQD